MNKGIDVSKDVISHIKNKDNHIEISDKYFDKDLNVIK